MSKQSPRARGKADFLVFGSPAIKSAEIQEVVKTLESGWLGTGPRVRQFEADIKAFTGSPHAIAVNSCTAALHLSLLAADIGAGDEVITTPLTFCATVNAIIHAGATPVLADIDPATLNIDPDQVRAKITSRTKAVLPVHYAGRPCEMDSLCSIAADHGLLMIEDCAHTIEAEYKGRKTGTFGDFGCFSFYVTKNVVTGEGGMIVAKNEAYASRAAVLALHGMSKDAWKRFGSEGFKHYEVIEAGFKYNMMDLQAAIGIHQLARVEANWRARERVWKKYNAAFADLPLELPPEPSADSKHSYHLYTVLVNEKRAGVSRDAFLNKMTEQGIGVGIHYLAIPEHVYYRNRFGWKLEDYPHAVKVGRETVSLPISAKLTAKDTEDVIRAVKRILL
jgi:dTDP-4-amino-4,6-dideoxygalactose transaminase